MAEIVCEEKFSEWGTLRPFDVNEWRAWSARCAPISSLAPSSSLIDAGVLLGSLLITPCPLGDPPVPFALDRMEGNLLSLTGLIAPLVDDEFPNRVDLGILALLGAPVIRIAPEIR